jgi:hypothetical protein
MSASRRPPPTDDMTDLIVPAALRIWLLFLLVFSLLGYSVLFSILFGALGGFAGGVVTAWWQSQGGEPLPLELGGSTATPPALKLPTFSWRRERRTPRRRRSR